MLNEKSTHPRPSRSIHGFFSVGPLPCRLRQAHVAPQINAIQGCGSGLFVLALPEALQGAQKTWCSITTKTAFFFHRTDLIVSKLKIIYRIAGNFREHKFSRITNKHARKKKIRDFYFRDKVTISDHTPHNFPHGNGDPQRVFQRQNNSKTLARLSKLVGRCRRRLTAMPKGGS